MDYTEFETWLDKVNSKIHPILKEYRGYLPPDEKYGVYRPYQEGLPNKCIPYPIQQVEKEIKGFVDVILSMKNKRHSVLEIGLGNFGGTHKLWQSIFDQVYTMEINRSLIEKVSRYGVFLKGKTYLLNDNSHNPSNLKYLPKKFDVLFIDGDHSYTGVKKDYLIYSKLVNDGIIGFHDAATDLYGVRQFLRELRNGDIDGEKHEINYIVYSDEIGIAYIHRQTSAARGFVNYG
jgi:hypothetical protein